MRRPRILALAAALVVAAAITLVSAADPSHPEASAEGTTRLVVGGKPTFGTPTIVDPVHTYGEPDIRVAPDGAVYDSGPWGTGTQRSLWEQSTDKGATFHPMHDTAVTSPDQSDSQIAGPGGGDTEISIDHTNKVYYADLAALEELKVATWKRSTHTMNTGVLQTPQSITNGIDRQWFALWDPPSAPGGYTGPLPVNYLSFAAATGGTSCSPPALSSCEVLEHSEDGISYSSPTAAAPIGSDGPLVIDQQTGTVFEAISIGANDVGIGIYQRDATNAADDPSLTKITEHKIADLPGGSDVGALFPVPAIDSARNVYVVWVTENTSKTVKQDATQWQIWYSYATAASNWATWSTPVQLSSAPSNTNIMPWAVAGSDGRLAAVWYGTPDSTHNPSSDDVHQPWNVYLANVSNAASASPTIQQVKVTRHPMHYGSICLAGTGCAAQNPPGNRNLADFFEDSVDPNTGALVITYDDTSNNLKQHDPSGSGAPPEQVAHTGAPQVVMIRQNGGIGMFGTAVHGPPAIRSYMGDKRKDARFDPVYSTKNIAQLDLRGFHVGRNKTNLVIRINASTLGNLSKATGATGAADLDWVARWDGPVTKNAPGTDGLSNPIYYAAAESSGSGTPSFFAGIARSVELCSVSGCFPHVLEYPEPPYAGTTIKGKLVKTKGPKADYLILRVPLTVIGSPTGGKLLEDFGVYVFARNKPASVPMTNAEGQGGITPIMVDGVCCRDVRLPRR